MSDRLRLNRWDYLGMAVLAGLALWIIYLLA